jgi:hypothetical protein
MDDLQKALDHLIVNVKQYRNTNTMDGEALVGILQQLTATLFYLEGERAKYHDEFQKIINTLVIEGKSVARSENEAHVQIPEMYMLRHIMSSAYEVVGAIRTQISWLKSERNAV